MTLNYRSPDPHPDAASLRAQRVAAYMTVFCGVLSCTAAYLWITANPDDKIPTVTMLLTGLVLSGVGLLWWWMVSIAEESL